MKYVSPKYEVSPLDVCDIIMSGEAGYTIEKSEDANGNTIGNVIMGALDLFK